MRRTACIPAAICCAALIALSGCRAEQTQEGRSPDVDVNVDPGQWPRYNIKWADVDVGTREQTVTVPVVRIEQETRQVTVPYIDINPPGAGAREERTISVDVDVPHAGYQLQITEVRAANDTLWVIARLTERSQPAAQAVTRVADQVVVNAPEDLNVRRIVVGQRPQGVQNQQYRFVDSMAALDQQIPAGGRVLYQRSDGQQGR